MVKTDTFLQNSPPSTQSEEAPPNAHSSVDNQAPNLQDKKEAPSFLVYTGKAVAKGAIQ